MVLIDTKMLRALVCQVHGEAASQQITPAVNEAFVPQLSLGKSCPDSVTENSCYDVKWTQIVTHHLTAAAPAQPPRYN